MSDGLAIVGRRWAHEERSSRRLSASRLIHTCVRRIAVRSGGAAVAVSHTPSRRPTETAGTIAAVWENTFRFAAPTISSNAQRSQIRFFLFAALLCVAAAKLLLSAPGSWTYDKQQDWPGVCGTGKHQSPIDIRTKDAKRVNMTELQFRNYGVDSQHGPFTVTGNGKSVRVYGFNGWEQRPYIKGGGLDGKYMLDEIHFHWYRKAERPGSEHSINGTHYPIEIHLVHRGKIEDREHIAVIAVFVELDNQKNGFTRSTFSGLLKMIEKMDKVEAPPGEDRTVTSVPKKSGTIFYPKDLLPEDLSRFYRYEGSLTTPNCDEIVTWTVMEKPLTVHGFEKWNRLTNVRMRNGPAEFVYNQRAQQDLNGRRVILRDPNASPSIAAHSRCAFWPLVTAIVTLLIVGVQLPGGIF